jgi:hypothetical protein
MSELNMITLKIVKAGPHWRCQLLGPGGRALWNSIDEHSTPLGAAEEGAKLVSLFLGGPVQVRPPAVGKVTAITNNIQLWRQS